MKEKIAVRIAEVQAWGELVEFLDGLDAVTSSNIERYTAELREEYPESGKEMKGDWRYRGILDYKIKLAAYENIRTVIFKAIG